MEQAKMRCVFYIRLWAIVAVLALATQQVNGKTLKYQMYEEQRVGTVVARLKEDVADVLVQLPSSVSLRFRAMQRANTPFFTVRDQDGEISIRTKIDREKLCEKNLNCTVEFDVLTLPTEHLQLFHIEVEVLDINDNAPQFARSVIPIEISESAAVGARIPLDSATDPDVGDNSLYSYSLQPNNFFKIDVQSRADGAKYTELVVLRELDREVQSSYELMYTASDRGVPARTGSTLLKISVTDSNDNSPVFDQSSYVINLSENSPVGTLIIDLNATDADEGTNAKILYSFSSHVSPKIMETFRMNSDSGHLTLIKRVDYESVASYDIDVQAQDMGPNSMPAHCKIQVKVADVNDNKPDISINLMSPQGKEEAAYVSEAAPPDTFVALVRVEDRDSGPNGEVVCRLHGQGHFKLVRSYENNYMVVTNVSLDREKRSEYSLTVVAEDRGAPSLSAAKHFAVHVSDENDNAPRFERARYEVSKAENNAPGAYLTSVSAVDPDLDANGRVTYSVVEELVHGSSISTYVTVDPSNGAVYALRALDREEVSRVAFVVQARDAGAPPLAGNATVVLTVLDENDNPPAIVAPALWNHTADVSAWRFTEARGLVAAVRATDRDAGPNAELTCAIVAGNEAGFFAMDARACEVRANASLAAFPGERADLTVTVRDGGAESLSARALLRVSLYESREEHKVQNQDGAESPLDASLVIIVSLGVVCAVLLVIMVAFAARCTREKKESRSSYNCRLAESAHQHRPRQPSRQVHKGEITLVPTVNGTLRAHHHHQHQHHHAQLQGSPPATPPLERAPMGSRQSRHSRQSLNSLVTISSNHIPESFALELTHATPPVEQVSQLLSMLHQGQYQPRPSFRGNKYSRSYRYALQDMDKFSLKDSGRGDSEAGDSDYDMGRESPVERLLLGGEGFSDLLHLDLHHRLHPAAMRQCTEECHVLGHSDQCWMPPLTALTSPGSASSDYRNNMYIPGEESGQPPAHGDQEGERESPDSAERHSTFSTFGKDAASPSDEGGASGGGGGGGTGSEAGGGGGGSLLSEMNIVFQRLLPPPAGSESHAEAGETGPPVAAATERGGHGNGGPQDNRKGPLPGGKGPSYPPGVAAWAANTHYLNPGNASGSGNPAHLPALSSSSSSSSSSSNANGQPPHLKWLPAMEEIPENFEEDDLEAVFQGHPGGKRSESRHEAIDASELVNEINKLLQDVRQS